MTNRKTHFALLAPTLVTLEGANQVGVALAVIDARCQRRECLCRNTLEHRDRKRDRERERGRGEGSEKKTRKTAWKSNKIRQADLLELNWIFLLLFFHCRPSHFFIFLCIDFLQRNLTSNNHISCNLFVCQLKFKANVRWLTLTVECWFLFFFLSLSFVCFASFLLLSLDCSASVLIYVAIKVVHK